MSEKSDSGSAEKPAGSGIPKPSGIKPPSTTSALPKVSRMCSHNHERKPELPAEATPKKSEHKLSDKMPRQIDEYYKTHQLPDVSEESEYELWSDRFGSWIGRSSKSKSPDSFKNLRFDRKSSSGVSSASPDFFEATGRRSSSDHGNDLTTDTDSFMIGQRVYVGGVRSGRITFIGEVHFAPGEWAGVVLDEAEGKNDGAVSGKRYFQCEPKKGIFSRLTRLTREPITSDGPTSMDTSFRSMTSPMRSGTTSPTYSVTSTSKTPFGTKTSTTLEVNDRVIVKSATGSRLGTLRYIGEPNFASGVWCGVEFEEANGKNDGSVSGTRYFVCAPNHGIFVPLSKVTLSPMARKARFSRANSQESLASNLTLGSMASTNTSKLRMKETQKRLSSLNKSPSATSTPKPSFSLQYKEKVAILSTQLEEEKKKSEDLQFSIEEAAISAEESDGAIQKYKDKVTQLENELQPGGNVQASGDHVSSVSSSHNEEIEKLRKELEELTLKLAVNEELKKSLQNEIQSLHEKLAETKNDSELKSSSLKASEECMKDEMNYLQKRIDDLEVELGDRSKTIESQTNEMVKIKASTSEDVAKLEALLKENLEKERNWTENILEKDSEIVTLKSQIVTLSSSDEGTKDLLKQKDDEILRLSEMENLQNGKLAEIEKSLNEKSEIFTKKELEMTSLQNSFTSVEAELAQLQKVSEQQREELREKTEASQQLQGKFEEQTNKMSVLQLELDRFQSSIKDSDESVQKSREIEENLKKQIAELLESKVKLESELTNKESSIREVSERLGGLEKEISERDKCIAGLEAEVASINKLSTERESTIGQWMKDFKDLESRTQASCQQFEASTKALSDELALAKKTHIEELEKNCANFDTEKNALNGKIEDLKRNSKSQNSQLEKTEKNVVLLTELKASLDEKLAARENELADLTTKFNKSERDDAEKASQLEKLQKAFEETSKKLQESEIMSKTLQDAKHALEVDKNDLNRKIGAFEEKVVQLSEFKTKLQQDLESTKSSTLDINSELSNMSKELFDKQVAFESYQGEAETAKLNLQRRVDELERQNELMNQQCTKLKGEMDCLHTQKIESENQLNQELQNIKQTSDEEKTELGRELNKLRSTFEDEKLQLSRGKQETQENLEKVREEFEAKVRDLEMTIQELRSEIDGARKLSRESQTSMGSVVDDLKKKEAQLSEELDKQRFQTDELKKSLDQMEASKEILKGEYEEKMSLHKNKIAKLEEDLKNIEEQRKMAAVGTEEKIKILDDIQQKCYEQEQSITDLKHQLENEKSMKAKLEVVIEESQQRFREIEDEQVDLVNREELLKVEKDELLRSIEQFKQLHQSLDEKLSLERKDSEHFKIVADEKGRQMEEKLNEMNDFIKSRDQERDIAIEKLHLREEEIVQLQAAVKSLEEKLQLDSDETHKLLTGKDEELLQIVHECTTKENLIAGLKMNLENLQACLSSSSIEKESSTTLVQELNQTISTRDMTIRELKMKVYEVEKANKDVDDQLKNFNRAKDQTATDNDSKVADLMEQISLLEMVKEKEVKDLESKVSMFESQMSIYRSDSETATSSQKLSQNRENDLLLKIKDLELHETELLLLNQTMKRQMEELETMKGIPKAGDAYDQEMSSHIEFLNSIISDMHKKNLKLTQKVEALVAAPSGGAEASGNGLDLEFLVKKKPAPRLYCDICEEFDAHDTEECPLQCSDMDLPAPTEKKERKIPPPRKYCDICEVFDKHETEDCPNADDETY